MASHKDRVEGEAEWPQGVWHYDHRKSEVVEGVPVFHLGDKGERELVCVVPAPKGAGDGQEGEPDTAAVRELHAVLRLIVVAPALAVAAASLLDAVATRGPDSTSVLNHVVSRAAPLAEALGRALGGEPPADDNGADPDDTHLAGKEGGNGKGE